MTHTLKQLQLLQQLIQRDEEKDEVVEVTVSKLVSYELEKLKRRQGRIREKLATFEGRYGLKTDQFQQKFREGTLGDETDFFEWSALADIEREVSQQLIEAEPVSNAPPNPGTAQ
jgi:hypothetical protein